jgi:hypothetical protein
MSDWIEIFDAVFWLSAGTLLTTFLGLALKYALKSKCETCSLCYGLINIARRVDLEAQTESKELEINHNLDSEEPKIEHKIENKQK